MRFLFLSFLLFANFLYSQDNSNEYIPSDLDAIEVYLKKINHNHISKIKGNYSAKIKKIFKDRDEKVLEAIEDSNYVFNSAINKNLDLILNNIYKSNPEINTSDFRFFIKNSIVPNAACYGDGMYEINLGLFTSLDSDDELAFIICHEIAHQLLEHSLKGVTKRVAVVNSKETKKKVRKIKRNRYGQTRAALSVIDELSLDILDYSKEVEAEADSLGYILFSKTNYNKNQSAVSLKKLEYLDDMILNHDVKIDSVFNFDNYAFKSYWLKETTSLFDTSEKIDEFGITSDTVKTHPEIKYRVDKLHRDFGVEIGNSQGENKYLKEINKVAHFNSIKYTIELKFLDLAIYQLIKKYNKNVISSDYYYSTMTEVLQLIFEAKKNHELGKYVPPKNNFSDEKHLNTIRLFLNNLELNEIKKIGLAFCESNKVEFKNNQKFEEAYKFFNN